MSLGTAIFLSAVLLSIVALFIATKDRWNWKKLVGWLFGVAAAVPIVAGVGFYVYSYIAELPKAQLSFCDIPLGATESDVKFLKGAPTEVQEQDHWIYKEAKSRSSDDESEYQFDLRRVRFALFCSPARVFSMPRTYKGFATVPHSKKFSRSLVPHRMSQYPRTT